MVEEKTTPTSYPLTTTYTHTHTLIKKIPENRKKYNFLKLEIACLCGLLWNLWDLNHSFANTSMLWTLLTHYVI